MAQAPACPAQPSAPATAAVLRNPRPRAGGRATGDRGSEPSNTAHDRLLAAIGPARGCCRPAAPTKAPAATATRGTAMIDPGRALRPRTGRAARRAQPVQPPRRPPLRRNAARAAASGPPRPPSRLLLVPSSLPPQSILRLPRSLHSALQQPIRPRPGNYPRPMTAVEPHMAVQARHPPVRRP